MIRKKKRYVRPKKLYEKARIEEENKLLALYGLKNKREIWKTLALVGYYRRRAKSLAKSSQEEQGTLFRKLQALGLQTRTIADVLALNGEDLLKRRLPTVLVRKGIARTIRQARQLVVHKNVTIHGRVVNAPSYLVSVADEPHITLRIQIPQPKKESADQGSSKQSQHEQAEKKESEEVPA